ncbi:MAG: glycine cleavage system aminomethyltransferase GcvT [Ignavibacteriae bacterium]|nr:glycine cleavage system aminomethyltransferase GcvT [Ignavibacteriota bacterium]
MKQTKFIDVHKKYGAKLVEFAGYEMPIQYSSIIAEHKVVRNSVGVFDVSHMGEIFIKGNNALDFVQYITVNNAAILSDGKVQYSAMCYEDAGIVDDLLVYKISDVEFLLVVNGANKDKDFEWMKKNNKFDVEINDESDEYSLLAVQGPNSQKVIEKLLDQKINLEYYTFFKTHFDGNEIIVSRTGYTGELGFELYFKGSKEFAENIWEKLFECGKEFDIQPTGLGCRDSLRLEMGFCLYGNDIDQTTNTLEAGLGWITKLKKDSFIGKDVLEKVKENGITRKLVPIIFNDKVFPRKGYEIMCDGKIIGKITSGTVSPTIDKPIALAYIEKNFTEEGTILQANIRGKGVETIITKLPFIKEKK